jgi:BirA family biotin operon repressor/biotin-[acetyl-CoA-carboxylase] ligase
MDPRLRGDDAESGFLQPQLGHFSFVASLALHDAIRDFLPQAAITLKWPNDVLANGKKIGGILLESGEGWLVIGIGLNVAHYPLDTLYPATSLQAEGLRQADLPKILNTLLTHISHWYATIQREGFAPVRAAWLQRAQKGELTVKLPDRTITGTFIALDDSGALRLRLPDGSENSIATGDVFFV